MRREDAGLEKRFPIVGSWFPRKPVPQDSAERGLAAGSAGMPTFQSKRRLRKRTAHHPMAADSQLLEEIFGPANASPIAATGPPGGRCVPGESGPRAMAAKPIRTPSCEGICAPVILDTLRVSDRLETEKPTRFRGLWRLLRPLWDRLDPCSAGVAPRFRAPLAQVAHSLPIAMLSGSGLRQNATRDRGNSRARNMLATQPGTKPNWIVFLSPAGRPGAAHALQ